MAIRSRLVNLDALIPRADFAIADENVASHEKPQQIVIRDLKADGFMRPLLRKPDFQRETNHWSPEQVVSLLECFVNGDLIPSVIIWKSPTFLFVIDGGHRLSAIRAWIEDDYGDGPVSTAFFGHAISREQKKSAERTRALVSERIGTWGHFQSILQSPNPIESELRRINTIASRAIHVQWVEGNAEKAEASFFKINTQGTALDDVEELLLSNRRKPLAISSRAIIRAGMGHKYWSQFGSPIKEEIESLAKNIYSTLFQPEVETPIKTLDLPLGGSAGVRAALQILIEFGLIAVRDQGGNPKALKEQADDEAGAGTRDTLKSCYRLASRMTGNERGSLGLHPAVYFYGPTGRHSAPMFLGTASFFARKLVNNDGQFFGKFTKVRSRLESGLIEHKDLIATVLQRTISKHRIGGYSALLNKMVEALAAADDAEISEAEIVSFSGLSGKIITGTAVAAGEQFSDDTKSAVFIKVALKNAIKCPICSGYLDTQKSVSYDHVQEKAAGGKGGEDNCQLTHPYCNQAVKNGAFQNSRAVAVE